MRSCAVGGNLTEVLRETRSSPVLQKGFLPPDAFRSTSRNTVLIAFIRIKLGIQSNPVQNPTPASEAGPETKSGKEGLAAGQNRNRPARNSRPLNRFTRPGRAS